MDSFFKFLKDTVFIITGGGSGIGKALALALVKRDKKVLIIGRRENMLAETAAFDSRIKYMAADVAKPEDLRAIKKYVSNEVRIEGLVNNAGTLLPLKPLATVDIDEWNQTFAVNLNASLLLPQLLLEQLTDARVLNISSGAAYFPVKGWAAYCCSKASLSMLTKCWQIEMNHLAFASVMPGIIDTDMQTILRSDANLDQEKMAFFRQLYLQNQLLNTATVASFLSWMLLDVDKTWYCSQEWDIYDTTHHRYWLKPPHEVRHWTN